MKPKDLELNMKKDRRLKDLREKRDSKSIGQSKKGEKLKDRLELKKKDLSMKNESKWKD